MANFDSWQCKNAWFTYWVDLGWLTGSGTNWEGEFTDSTVSLRSHSSLLLPATPSFPFLTGKYASSCPCLFIGKQQLAQARGLTRPISLSCQPFLSCVIWYHKNGGNELAIWGDTLIFSVWEHLAPSSKHASKFSALLSYCHMALLQKVWGQCPHS